MLIGMPVVAIGATEVARAVPEGAGIVPTRVDDLVDAVRWLLADPEAPVGSGRPAAPPSATTSTASPSTGTGCWS